MVQLEHCPLHTTTATFTCLGVMETGAVPGAFTELSESPCSNSLAHDEESRQPTVVTQKPVVVSIPPAANHTTMAADGTPKEPKTYGQRPGDELQELEFQSPRLRSSRTWKVRGADLLNEKREPRRPLSLLDLPMDILKEIVREVTHTNDLTSLALCHSALHRLTIPHIYSRFDIVWPDTSTHAEPRSGVDALTYGLATLVMAEEVFGDASHQARVQSNRFNAGKGRATESMIRRRRGNHYAQYTKKFSLGNGPADWVQEYLISKEGGKMLGTLVALAVARMRSLETFVWDMPTGVLRDVWLALSSLADHEDVRPCRLQKVWMRWHDNTPIEAAQSPPPPYIAPPVSLQAPLGTTLQGASTVRRFRPEDLDHVEHPNFSILPALRSLSVLDIDELAYLDEMAVLIERSRERLRELRVGIARHAVAREWVSVWEDDSLQQIDHDEPTASSLSIGEKRCGGILGTLTGLVHDMRADKATHRRRPTGKQSPPRSMSNEAGTGTSGAMTEALQTLSPPRGTAIVDMAEDSDPLIASSRAASPQPASPDQEESPASHSPDADRSASVAPQEGNTRLVQIDDEIEEELPHHQLQLETLELERIPLSIDAMQKALDWSKLTCLTILNCEHHELLWKTLRRTFSPIPKSSSSSRSRPSFSARKSSKSSLLGTDIEMSYPLSLKRIHTNTVSMALISFLRETLAPNSLEVLFLQESRSYAPSVTVDSIFKGPLRRHRASLKKVLIDSSEKSPDGLPTTSNRWRRWMLSREVLTFVCSGKMPRLRELGMALEYRDWVSRVVMRMRSLLTPISTSSCNTSLPSHIFDRSIYHSWPIMSMARTLIPESWLYRLLTSLLYGLR